MHCVRSNCRASKYTDAHSHTRYAVFCVWIAQMARNHFVFYDARPVASRCASPFCVFPFCSGRLNSVHVKRKSSHSPASRPTNRSVGRSVRNCNGWDKCSRELLSPSPFVLNRIFSISFVQHKHTLTWSFALFIVLWSQCNCVPIFFFLLFFFSFLFTLWSCVVCLDASHRVRIIVNEETESPNALDPILDAFYLSDSPFCAVPRRESERAQQQRDFIDFLFDIKIVLWLKYAYACAMRASIHHIDNGRLWRLRWWRRWTREMKKKAIFRWFGFDCKFHNLNVGMKIAPGTCGS